MADARRSLAALQSLLADNTSGDISPQDIRDVLLSVVPPRGSFYVSAAAETTISGSGTWTKASGTTTSVSLVSFTMPANNRLTYAETQSRRALIAVSASIKPAATDKQIAVGVYHYDDSGASGAILSDSVQTAYLTTATGETQYSLLAECTIETDDYLELHIKNDTDAVNATVTNASFRVVTWLQ